MPRTILLATRNEGKLREIRAILGDIPFRIEGLDTAPSLREIPEVEETGATLEENALLKARAIHRLAGLPALSDDSGLEVEYLGGGPGVLSARFAGPGATYDDNNRKLLAMLARAGPGERRARFRCVAAYAAGGVERTCEGICEGTIIGECRGGGGFGYDPLFVPRGSDLTFAEMPARVKNGLSHRAAAFREMAAFLRTLASGG
jgi:XTP/dITP diphosphohydrolase